MSAVLDLIAEAEKAGIRFIAKGPGELGMRAKEKPPADLLQKIRAARPVLLAIYGSLPVEVPAQWAEGMRHLTAAECPAIVPMATWRSLSADSAYFVASPLSARAAELGWSIADLWGCHATRPIDRLDCRGILWAVGGGELLAITADALIIRTEASARLRCQRPRPRSGEPVVMPWELHGAAGPQASTDAGPPDAA
jgi:hypothetical protein